MNRERILNLMAELAKAQGKWQRLYNEFISMDSAEQNAVMNLWEKENFKDEVDFIISIGG